MINIVLISPQIPQNTGNIARTCAATGARLHLVRPMGFEVDDKKLKRAGLDYWYDLDITYYENIDEFYRENSDGNFFYLTTKAKKIYSDCELTGEVYLVFGREDKGLPEELLLQNRENCIRLPMASTARSLNLSNAVAIVVYESLRQQGFEGLQTEGQLHFNKW